MYKVLICDDEKMGIKSLIATVDWAKNGFEVAGEAYDGLSALEMIEKIRPNLVFTDIRMPGLNGLELMKKVNSLSIRTLFVAISGYAEFAYVQKAINCGAIGYCLKPYEESEISSILQKAKTAIDMSKTTFETELLNLILDRRQEKEEREIEILKMLGFEWTNNTEIITIVVKGEEIPDFLTEYNCVRLGLGSTKKAYLIHSGRFKETQSAISESLEKYDIVIGLNGPCSQLRELGQAIGNASVASDEDFMTGRKGLYDYADLMKADFGSILSQLQEVLSKRDFTETMKFFDFVEEAFSRGSYSVKHAFKFYNVIMYSFQTINISSSQFLDDGEQLINTFKDIRDMLGYLRNMLVEPFGVYNKSNTMEVKNETFRNIIKYVNEEFFEDLSIQTIARKFTINSNYVSQLFKKETGVTFTEYLTSLRVNYAICLLKTTDLPVSVVAEKSGFGDYFYFTRVFKKSTGKTPSVYRAKYGNMHRAAELKKPAGTENKKADGNSPMGNDME